MHWCLLLNIGDFLFKLKNLRLSRHKFHSLGDAYISRFWKNLLQPLGGKWPGSGMPHKIVILIDLVDTFCSNTHFCS